MFLLLKKGFVRLLRQILDCLKIQYSEVAALCWTNYGKSRLKLFEGCFSSLRYFLNMTLLVIIILFLSSEISTLSSHILKCAR